MTGMGRETGLARDQGQERPGMPGTLNPGGFGAKTAILDVRSGWRRKPGTLNGLTRDCRHRYRQEGKSSRNVCEKRETKCSIDNIPRSRYGARPNDPANYDPRAGHRPS